MKTAVVSDIHGNLVALEAVLKIIEKESCDKLVFLGDAAATGPEPHNVLAKLRAKNPICVMGNTDEWLLSPSPRLNPDADAKVMEEIDFWCAEQLTESDRDFLRSFKPTMRVRIGEDAELLAYHGSPKSNREGVPPVGTPQELEAVLLGERAKVMAGGHLHLQMLRWYQDSVLINPGSVGLPYERDPVTGKVSIPARSDIAFVSYDGGKLDISFRRIPLSQTEVTKSISGSEMPHKAEFMDRWASIASRLIAREKLA